MIDLKTVLESAKTIAVMGCSSHPSTVSYRISRYLKEAGFRMIPVNPNHQEVHGERCYPDLQSIPAGVQIDIVNIFRRPQYTADMVRQAVAWAQANGTKPVVWTQVGVSSSEAETLANEAGLPYVRNRCILVEHSRLIPTGD